ncbi:MAG: GIY-YIG nuclease family protein [Chitinophagaceae bacterium]
MLVNSKVYSFYITTNIKKTVVYCGVTNNLGQRIVEHYLSLGNPATFAGKYHCFWLVYYEHFQYINTAIAREKEVKKWRREKKNNLIETLNPEWSFLNKELLGEWPPSTMYHRKDFS